MKVNNLNLPYVAKSHVLTPNYQTKMLQNYNKPAEVGDTFVRNVNFTANHLQKVDLCAGLLRKHIMTEAVSLAEIEGILKKFVPDVSVKPLGNLDGSLSKRYIAYTSIKIGEPEVIYLDVENNIADTPQRIQLLGRCVHEFTHVAQNREPHFSAERFISKVIDDYPDSPSLRNTIKKLREFAANIELYATYPVLKGMKNEKGLPVPYKGSENKLLQKFTSNQIGSYDKYIDNLLIKSFSDAAESDLNLPVLLKYSQMYFKQELEAYTKETEVMKSIMNLGRQTTDFDVRNFAYTRLIQRCDEFRKKFAK